jgi:outer membrane biosynthesis protein TonB
VEKSQQPPPPPQQQRPKPSSEEVIIPEEDTTPRFEDVDVNAAAVEAASLAAIEQRSRDNSEIANLLSELKLCGGAMTSTTTMQQPVESTEDLDLGFDPFYETQKAFEKLIQEEVSSSSLRYNNNHLQQNQPSQFQQLVGGGNYLLIIHLIINY